MIGESDLRRKALSRAFARQVSGVLVESSTKQYLDLVREYRRIEREYVERCADNRSAALDLRRRTAEMIFSAGIERRCSLSTSRRRFRELCRLGFTDVERKTEFYLIYSRRLLRYGRARAALRLLRQIQSELGRRLQTKQSRLGRDLLQLVDQLLQQPKTQSMLSLRRQK